jgi:oxygen-independent coproporphyrinogen-3 oxidase
MESSAKRGIYIHVPFCKSRCHFCAFYLEIYHPNQAGRFVSSLLREITWYAARGLFTDRPIESVYFGGGTPTTLSGWQLSLILSTIRERFPLEPQAEVTIEAHPDAMTAPYLDTLMEVGCNRISFGAESMNQDELISIGRPGSASAATRSVELARKCGFENINLDLMYGLAGQTPESWLRTLHSAIAMKPTHLSCYALTIEEHTRLESEIDHGLMEEPDPEIQNELEALADKELAAANFHRYEISNYQRAGHACRHNLLYWTGGYYLGLGPSAQSYFGDLRYGNIPDLKTYIRLLDQGNLPVTELDILSSDQLRREHFVFGLRKTEGVPSNIWPHEDDAQWILAVQRLIQENLLVQTDDRIALTDPGRRFADSIALQLL